MSSTPPYTYQAPQAGGGQAFIVGADGAVVPLNLENTDYQAFLAWVAAGNPAPEGWTGPTNTSPG